MHKPLLSLALALAALTAAPTFAAETAPKTIATTDAQVAQLTKEVSELRHQLAKQGAELKRLAASSIGIEPHQAPLRSPARAPAN